MRPTLLRVGTVPGRVANGSRFCRWWGEGNGWARIESTGKTSLTHSLPRTVLTSMVAICLIAASAAAKPAKHNPARQSSADSDMLLSVFQRMDQHLTALDADNQSLRAARKRIAQLRSPARRRRMLRHVLRSREVRARLRTVNQLLKISTRAERTYRRRGERYGALLFRELNQRIAAVRKNLLDEQTATATAAFDHDETLISRRLLPLVMQFQAISGGYAALACHPGSWACCQPRVTKDGKIELRGCSWSCASRVAACRGGCLGPRTPSTVVAVKNGAHKPRLGKQAQVLASNHARKPKFGERANAITKSQSSASGSE